MHQSLVRPCVVTVIALLAGATFHLATASGAGAQADVSAAYGRLPLSFEANEGQVDKAVKFLSRGQGYTLFLTSDEAVVRMRVAGGLRGSPGWTRKRRCQRLL
jgi:hypothetical protein